MAATDARPAPSGDLDHAERCLIYRWLAGVFAREPTAEALAQYRTDEGRVLLASLARHAALAPLAGAIERRVEGDEALDGIALDLAGAYAQLFHGVAGRRSVPPYESAYTSDRGLLFQEPTQAAEAVLAELDVGVDSGFREPADHIAVLLAIMAEMSARAVAEQAEEPAWTDRQRAFLGTRLAPWTAAFRDDCATADRTGFYAAAAESVAGFVQSDLTALAAT